MSRVKITMRGSNGLKFKASFIAESKVWTEVLIYLCDKADKQQGVKSAETGRDKLGRFISPLADPELFAKRNIKGDTQ